MEKEIPDIEDKIKLIEYVQKMLEPKEIEKNIYGEIYTPLPLITKMLEDMKQYIPDLFTNKNRTFYDPCCGMGNFQIILYDELMKGLKFEFPDINERKKYILEKMLYMGEINNKNCIIFKKIFNKDNIYKLNLYEGDTLEVDNVYKYFDKNKDFKFDVILGNPPFNKPNSNSPLYDIFVIKYIKRSKYFSFIIPTRWLSKNNKANDFKNFMFKEITLKYIKHFSNPLSEGFKSISLKGGINYFLNHDEYKGKCNFNGVEYNMTDLDKIIHDDICENIQNLNVKILEINEMFKNYKKLKEIYKPTLYFGIKTNYTKYLDCENENTYKCYVSKKIGGENRIKYINKYEIKDDNNLLKKYKVFTVEAVGNGPSGFGPRIKGYKYEICNQSYIFFYVDNEIEMDSLYSYLDCKLPHVLLYTSKKTQHVSKETIENIPLVPLNRIWTDETIYEYFWPASLAMSDEYINIINQTYELMNKK